MKIKEYLKEKSGFTLVELLVVIVIIGILAVGVLAAINPIEQIRRGRDTARQATAREFMGAVERYYGVREEYPWGTTPSSYRPIGTATITNLEDEEELKTGFSNRSAIANSELSVYQEDAGAQIRVCFVAESDAFQDKGTLCNAPNDCTATGTYYCLPDSGD